MLILIDKLASFTKSASQRGEDRGGKYLMRVVTGRDKDNSPQYRYIRTEEELQAYKKRHKDTKITHEKQKKESEEIKDKTKGSAEKTVEKKKVKDDKNLKSKKVSKDKESKRKLFVQDSKKEAKKSIYV